MGIPVEFTMDNIDINPKANTSKGSFHGTILSVLQTPTKSNMVQYDHLEPSKMIICIVNSLMLMQ